VNPPDEMSGVQVAVVALEIALHAAGLALLAWLAFSRRGRALPKAQLPEWDIPGIEFVLFICFGLMGAMVVNALAGLVLQRVHLSSDASVVAASAAMEGGFLLGMLSFHALYRGYAARAGARPGIGRGLAGGLFTFLAAMPLVTAVNYGWGAFLTRAGLPDEKQELVGILENTRSAVLKALFVMVATLLVPAAEEVLFRGGLFRYMRTRMPRWVALASTSIVFGALHVQWSDHMGGLASLLPLIVLAATFCIAYERTGSILTPIVAHALFNLNMIILVVTGFGS
jgi:membrane protease YdiL (CAAX protease family)